ncbi:MAG TPA: ABC transporter substrate-binding protein [Chloroflexota bacterium]|nr:ABC transporter substrate-binding protein [Chloroflexota bacterium]
MPKHSLRTLASCVLLLVLAGCGASGGSYGSSGSANSVGANSGPKAPAGQSGTLYMDWTNDLSHLDTGKCYDTECWPYMYAMFDRLIDYKTDSTNDDQFVPDGAVAMPTVTNGGKTYTFRLRRNIHFWNGKLVTSADWKYSFERIINPKTQAGAASFWTEIVGASAYASGKAKHVSGIQTLGKWGLRIKLLNPDASFLNVLAMPFGSVVDQAVVQKYGRSYDCCHVMGTGRYMLKEHIINQRMVLVPNPHYWGGKAATGHLKTIEADFGISEDTGLLRIERGSADLDGDGIPAADFVSVRNDPKWSKLMFHYTEVGTYYIPMNTLMKPFTNVLVRRAINYAINKSIIVRLINGRGVVTNTILPPSMPGHGSFNLYPYNPAKARQLLKQAGYPHGFSTTFWTDNVGDDSRISQNIVQQLAGIGVHASLKVVNGNTLTAAVGTKRKVPITFEAWFQDFPDPNDFFEPIFSCASAVPGTFNEPWYCDPKVDRYANQLKVMQNRAQRLRLYPRLDKMVMQDAPIVPLYNPVFWDIHSTALKGYLYHNVEEWIFQHMWKG